MRKSASFTKTHEKIKYITLSGIFAAMIFIVTSIHIPTGNGYTHAGDGIIYLSACILPMPYAIASSIIGGILADGLAGFAVWIPATIVVKALTAMCFSSKTSRILSLRNMLGIIPSLLLCIVGYSLYEGIVITRNFSSVTIAAAFLQTPSYIVQIAASSVLFISIGLMLDKMNFKARFGFYNN